jgi:nitrous oxidase accessory protein
MGAPARPGGCEVVAAGGVLRERLAQAPAGAVFCLEPGVHDGPLHIERGVTLWGDARSVVRSLGGGSTIEVDANHVVLSGFQVDGSGGRFDLLDAAIRIRADDVRVEGIEIRNALFGILAEQCQRPILRDNLVVGRPAQALGLRGDAIRLWEVRGAHVEGNRIVDSRDMVVWYSREGTFLDNQVSGGRYGTHFMYSHDNRVVGNRYIGNVVGIFAMYSRGLEIRGNLIADSGGAAGVGIGAKESGGLQVTDNWLIGNTIGVYLDTSPLHPDQTNEFNGNAIRSGEVGVVFHGPSVRNTFRANRFADHHVPVRVEGRGSARDAEWLGNDFDDYAGYDFDGDGVGDVPYVLRNLGVELATRAPAIRYFQGTPAMTLIEWLGRVVPLFQPTILLEDPVPAMRVAEPPPVAVAAHAG